jgi:hypothetical protein
MFGLRLGKLGAALKAGTGSAGVSPLFSRDFALGTLGASPTFARASSATVIDHEDVIRTVPSGAARFDGLRYVRNLFNNTTTTLATSASTTAVSVGVGTYIFSMGAGSGTATFSGTATGSTGTLNADASNRTAKTITITVAGTIIVTASVADLATIQLENSTGRTDTTTPSEYVSVGVESAPYHGAGVDGVRYFATENGNSVLSNVVTEGTGAVITGGSLLMEPAATNLMPNSKGYTVWRASGTVTATQNYGIAPDGTTTSTRIQGSGGAWIWIDDASVMSSGLAYVVSAYVRRVGGSDQTFRLFANGNKISGNLTATSEWQRFSYIFTSDSTSITAGLIRDTSNNDADIEFAEFNVVQSSVLSSPIPTTGTAVTRAADTLSYALTTPQAEGMVVFSHVPQVDAYVGNNSLLSFSTADSFNVMYNSASQQRIYDGTNIGFVNGLIIKDDNSVVASRWSTPSNEIQIGTKESGSWTQGTAKPYDGAFASNNNLVLCRGIGYPFEISGVYVYNTDQGTEWIEANY